jgi:heme oxygenase
MLVTRMQLLRQATLEAHTDIERALPLLQPGLTLALYTRVLAAFYGFYALLEPLCQGAAGQGAAALDLPRRAKTPLLETDLTLLGHTPATLLALPRCRALPQVTSMSDAIGALYVMEGATLGGQIISRHLFDALHLDAQKGAAFFSGYGEQTGEMWRSFAMHVERADGLEIVPAMAAAVETFELLEGWFVETLGPS